MTSIVNKERKTYSQIKYNRYQRKTVVLETIAGWSFVSPLLIVAIIFSTTAVGIAVWLTFQSGSSINNLHFVGFQNWKRIFEKSFHLSVAIKNTFLYATVSVPIIIVTSLIISAILNSSWIKFKRLFLAIFFLPQVTSAVASTLIFRQLFSKNGFIKLDYGANPKLVLWVVIISAVWGGVAGSLITFNTAFATIDNTQYEAADLDGAGGLKKFLNITIPSIGPIIAYSLIMGIIGGMGVFDGPYLMAVTTGLDADQFTTLIFKGFNYIIPSSAYSRVNLGVGTTILFFTALLISGMTFVGNIIFPISKTTN